MTFAELLAHPDVVQEVALRSRAGFLALHGGLEPGTAELARAAASAAGASCYTLVQPDDLRHHVPSHESDPALSTELTAFLAHVDVVVSVHGYFHRREALGHAILVGGADRGLTRRLAARLRAALPEVAVVDDPDAIPVDLRGRNPHNPVNCTAGGGVQLELPPRVRAIGRHGDRPGAEEHRARTQTLVLALADFAREQAA